MDVTLCLTRDCNLACRYCYAGPKLPERMPPKVAESALRLALSFPDQSMTLSYFGGEPLLEWDNLARTTELAEHLAAERGVRLYRRLTTNATLLTSERASWLVRNGFRVELSIDGDRRMHDSGRRFRDGHTSFDACMRGLDALLRLRPGAGVVVVPDPVNVSHLAEGVRYLVEEARVRRLQLNPDFLAEWPAAARDVWREQYERIGAMYVEWFRRGMPVSVNFINSKIAARLEGGVDAHALCGFAEREIAVATSGRIYACERMVGADDGASSIGDISSGIDEGRRRSLLAGGCERRECSGCDEAYRCISFCKATNLRSTGSAHTPCDALCFHERMTARIADYAGGLLVKEDNAEFMRLFGGFKIRSDCLRPCV